MLRMIEDGREAKAKAKAKAKATAKARQGKQRILRNMWSYEATIAGDHDG